MWISDPTPALLNDKLHFKKRPRWFLGTLRAKRCWTRACLGETDQGAVRPHCTNAALLWRCSQPSPFHPEYVFLLSRVWFSRTQWTAVHQVYLSMKYSRQEYWSEVPLPTPGDLPDPGIESMSLTSSALAGRFFTNCMTWEALSFSESICIGLWVHMFAICWNSEMKAEMCSWKWVIYILLSNF